MPLKKISSRKISENCATERRRSLLPVKAAAKAATDQGEIMNTTTYIRYSEPTVRNNISQAYSQCLPETDYGYSQQPNYGYSPEPQSASYYDGYAPVPQQQIPVQAQVGQSSSGKGLLFVAGLAVI